MGLRFRAIYEEEFVTVTDDETYAPWKLHKRNEYMVNMADEIWAWWNGDRSGGTYACVKYAHKKGKKIVNLYKKFHNLDNVV